MATQIALLRGINVSGHRRIPMAALRADLETLGFENVRTYLQSGNVVFETDREPQECKDAIQTQIAKDFGHTVAVLMLCPAEVAEIVQTNPFETINFEEKWRHVTFLSKPVSKMEFAKLTLPTLPGEQAVLAGQAILLYCPHGYGETKLSNHLFEKGLGVSATTRNWKTVLALYAMSHDREKT